MLKSEGKKMAEKDDANFDKETIKNDPAQTIAPPQLTLQEEPIPDPDIKDENKN